MSAVLEAGREHVRAPPGRRLAYPVITHTHYM